MDLIENGMHGSKGSSTEIDKSFPDTLWPVEGFLKHILTHLYCTKCNEIKMYHSNFHKHVSYKKWCK